MNPVRVASSLLKFFAVDENGRDFHLYDMEPPYPKGGERWDAMGEAIRRVGLEHGVEWDNLLGIRSEIWKDGALVHAEINLK